MKVYFQIAERSLSYAKIGIKFIPTKYNKLNIYKYVPAAKKRHLFFAVSVFYINFAQ